MLLEGDLRFLAVTGFDGEVLGLRDESCGSAVLVEDLALVGDFFGDAVVEFFEGAADVDYEVLRFVISNESFHFIQLMPEHLSKILLALIIQNRIRITCPKEGLKNLFWLTTEMIAALEHHEKVIFLLHFTLFTFFNTLFRLLFLPLRLDLLSGLVLLLVQGFLFGFFLLGFLCPFWVLLFPFPLLLDLGGCLILFLFNFCLLLFPFLLNGSSGLILFLMFFLLPPRLLFLPLALDHSCSFVLLFVHSYFSLPPLSLDCFCCQCLFLALFKLGVLIDSLSVSLLDYGGGFVLFFLDFGNLDLLFSLPLSLD